MTLQSLDPSQPWTDYTLTSAESGKTYRLALRGEQRGQSYLLVPGLPHQHAGHVQTHHECPGKGQTPVPRLGPAAALQVRATAGPPALRRPIGAAAGRARPASGASRADRPPAARPRHQRPPRSCAADPAPAAAGPGRRRRPRRSGVHRRAIVPGPHQGPRGGDSPRSGQTPLAEDAAENRTAALPAGRNRLCHRQGPGGPGGRHGAGQDDSRGRRGGTAGPRGRDPQGAGRLSRVPQVAVAERNPAVQRARLPTGARPRRQPRVPVQQRLLLYDLQLRASAAGHLGHRARQVGLDHPGRRPADQELGSQDERRDQGFEEPVCPGAVRHAAGEPLGRTLLRRPVHRRPAAGPGVPLLQSPPGGGRKRQSARLPEPGPVAAEPEADPAAADARPA